MCRQISIAEFLGENWITKSPISPYKSNSLRLPVARRAWTLRMDLPQITRKLRSVKLDPGANKSHAKKSR